MSQCAVSSVYPFLFAQYYIIYHFANLTYKTHPGSAYQIQKSPLFCYSSTIFYFVVILFSYSIYWDWRVAGIGRRLFLASSRRPPFFRRYTCVVYPFLEAVSRLLKGPFLVVLFGSQPQEPLNSLHFIKCHLCCFVACKSASFVCKTPLFNTDIRNRWT